LCLNYIDFQSFVCTTQGKVSGAECLDTIDDIRFCIKAKKVINACGPWVDELRKKDNSLKKKRLQLTKGVHIVVPKHKLPIQQSVYFDVEDGRMIFAIPRGSKVYLGTTDTNYTDDINFPFSTKEDVVYILKAANRMFPTTQLNLDDVESSWAGLRPLIHEEGKSPSDLSRKDEIFISDSNLISIAGGKLTGFRKMAERSVNVVCKQLKLEEGRVFKECTTEFIKLTGGNIDENPNEYAVGLQQDFKQFSLEDVLELVLKYGSNTQYILSSAENFNNNLLLAEAEYCLENELTNNTADFLIRRTGRLYFNRPELNKYVEELDQYFHQQLNCLAVNVTKNRRYFEKEYEGVIAFKNT